VRRGKRRTADAGKSVAGETERASPQGTTAASGTHTVLRKHEHLEGR
jgi:hypothetical protein